MTLHQILSLSLTAFAPSGFSPSASTHAAAERLSPLPTGWDDSLHDAMCILQQPIMKQRGDDEYVAVRRSRYIVS